jgi:hypothetical protein
MYFISFYSPYHPSSRYGSFFSFSFLVLRKIVFTGTLAILDCIQRFSTSNKIFSHKLITDSESARKTELHDVSVKLVWQLSFFDLFSTIPEKMKENESCQTNLKDASFNSVFRADSESVIGLWLKVLFEVENRWIQSKMARVSVKTIFLSKRKEKEKNDP